MKIFIFYSGLLLDLLQADGDRGPGVDVVNLLAAARNNTLGAPCPPPSPVPHQRLEVQEEVVEAGAPQRELAAVHHAGRLVPHQVPGGQDHLTRDT